MSDSEGYSDYSDVDSGEEEANHGIRTFMNGVSQDDLDRSMQLAAKVGHTSRQVYASRRTSPIVGDPYFVPPPSQDVLSQNELAELERQYVTLPSGKPIGEGEFAMIFKGQFNNGTHQLTMAVKRSLSYRQAWAEFETMKLLSERKLHKSIVPYFGMTLIDNHMYIFMEYSSLGDLPNYLHTEFSDSNPITEEDMCKMLKQVGGGLLYMHKHGIAHRDVKIHNVLVYPAPTKYTKYKVLCKLSDFGASRIHWSGGENAVTPSNTIVGSPKVMAPEVADRPCDPFIADTYSLGVLLYQLSHRGLYPFKLPDVNSSEPKQLEKLVKQYAALKRQTQKIVWSQELSHELKDLLLHMLEPDPESRVGLKDVNSSEWVRSHKASHKARREQYESRRQEWNTVDSDEDQ